MEWVTWPKTHGLHRHRVQALVTKSSVQPCACALLVTRGASIMNGWQGLLCLQARCKGCWNRASAAAGGAPPLRLRRSAVATQLQPLQWLSRPSKRSFLRGNSSAATQGQL